MLNTDAKPKSHRPRPIPYALHTKVDAELKRMRKEGILKPVEKSEWAAPIVVEELCSFRKGGPSFDLWSKTLP